MNKTYSHTAQFVKSQILNKAVYYILFIDTFEQQCVVINCMLRSPRLEDHMTTIGIDQSLYKKSSFEHKCLNSIKKIYQHAGKCDYQQNLYDIIYSAMVLTPEGVTDYSRNVPTTSTPVKKLSARKSLCLFTKILNI